LFRITGDYAESSIVPRTVDFIVEEDAFGEWGAYVTTFGPTSIEFPIYFAD